MVKITDSKGFSLLIVLVFVVIIGVVGYIGFNAISSNSSDTELSNEQYGSSSDYSDTTQTTLVEYKTLGCTNLNATFRVPADFVVYEETNAQGEQVCLMSNEIQKGQVSPAKISMLIFATQNTTAKLGMSSLDAAKRDTKKYGGMTDLPEEVVRDGALSTFHVIVPDAQGGKASQFVDSISNDDTDTFYTVMLIVPKTLAQTVDTQEIMNGYYLSESF